MMKNVIIFLSGVAVGIAGTALWTMKKLVPELREEAARQAHEDIHPVPDYSEYSDGGDEEEKKEDDSEEDDIPAPAPAETKKTVQENREAPSVDYSRYAETPAKKPDKKPETKNEARHEDEDAHTGPYVIDVSEYDIRGDYRSHSYTRYTDGIIVDDDSGKVMNFDPFKVFGKTAMDELEKEDVVYVRDDIHKRDYRVEQMDFEYDGPDPEDEDDWGL